MHTQGIMNYFASSLNVPTTWFWQSCYCGLDLVTRNQVRTLEQLGEERERYLRAMPSLDWQLWFSCLRYERLKFDFRKNYHSPQMLNLRRLDALGRRRQMIRRNENVARHRRNDFHRRIRSRRRRRQRRWRRIEAGRIERRRRCGRLTVAVTGLAHHVAVESQQVKEAWRKKWVSKFTQSCLWHWANT